MPEKLFVFLATAVAGNVTGFRRGARHAQMIFAKAGSVEQAESVAILASEGAGWSLVEVERSKLLDSDTSFPDYTVQAAAEHAQIHGYSVISYEDEIPSDA